MRVTVGLGMAMLLAGCAGPVMMAPDASLPDGSLYQGDIEAGLFHGRGTLRRDARSWYEGEFAEGRMHGQGEMHSPSGVYRGSFREGRFHGQGRWEDRHGQVIEGTFATGEPAQVVLTGERGRYEGEMATWRFHGQGQFRFGEGGLYTGRFEKGELVEGRYEDEYRRYEGAFSRWLFHGQGTLAQGDPEETLSGRFEYGSLAEGVYRFADGSEYRGEFYYGRPQGEGELTFADGSRFVGAFRSGSPDGSGTLHPAEGKPVRGRWHGERFYPAGEKTPPELRAETVETILRTDNDRLDAALAAIQPQQPGLAEVYYLIVGGDGGDDVFTRDVVVARDALEQAYPAAGRGVVLVNDRRYQQWPLATRDNLRQALSRLAVQMDTQQDLLFIHLASHGDKAGSLSLDQPGMALPDLTPEEFAGMLAPLDIGRYAMVVSACHAGHWLDQLAQDDNLILASAHRERSSFGCGNASEMTWFTKAVYQHAGLDLSRPHDKWRLVESAIADWEQEREMAADKRSLPQIHVGKAFAWQAPAVPEPEVAAE